MKSFVNNKILWGIALSALLLDQITKLWALKFLGFDKEVPINSMFSFHRIFNESSIMMDVNLVQSSSFISEVWHFRLAYALMAFIFLAVIIWVTNQPAMKENETSANFSKLGLFLILGGIFGNAFDRIFRKEGVVDFIRVKDQFEWDFIFNLADVFVYLGEGFIVTAWIIVIIKLIIPKCRIIAQVK